MEAILNGIRIRFDDEGAGPAVMLLHAFPFSAAMWRPQIEALRGRYRVIAPDLRGFGGSDAPPGPYLMDTMADDAAALLEYLHIPQAVIVGLSMGGYIAFAFWRRHRDKVAALALADTRAGADSEERRAERETNARLVEEQGAGAIADKLIPNLVADAAPQALRDHLRELISANSPVGIAGALRGMALRVDSSADLPGINVPTLAIVGEEDRLSPPSEVESMIAAIPNGRLVRIPGAGHLSNLEQPEAFNAALLAFLDQLPR